MNRVKMRTIRWKVKIHKKIKKKRKRRKEEDKIGNEEIQFMIKMVSNDLVMCIRNAQ